MSGGGRRSLGHATITLYAFRPACDAPFLTLDAGIDKNWKGNSITLRADLADNLRKWLTHRLELRQKAICEPSTRSLTGATELRAGVSGNTEASRLSPDDPLFKVPSGILRLLNRDLKVAGIPKCDDRG